MERRRYPIRYKDLALGHKSEGYRRYPKLIEIESETTQILQGIPTDTAVGIALAVSREMPDPNPPRGRLGDGYIPGIAIFSREGKNPDDVWKKLLGVLKTPDFETRSFDPEVRPLIDALKNTIYRTGYIEGTAGTVASMHMIRVAGGDSAAIYWEYRDMGRRYPQYTNSWNEVLLWQFNGQFIPGKPGSEIEEGLTSMLEQGLVIAQRYNEKHSSRQNAENLSDYITRQHEQAREIFNINSMEDFTRAVAIMDRVFIDYRKEAYALRGIPYDG